MEKDILLSVIIPVYNTEKYLDECLKSMAAQSCPFDEVILVNDGSTDGSRTLCERYCNLNNNFLLINQPNLGLSEARNTGLKAAKGDYVIFIDSDDYVQADMSEKIKGELSYRSYDILHYNASVVYELDAGEPQSYFTQESSYCNRDMTGLEYIVETFPANYIVSACLGAYRKEFLSEQNIWFAKGLYFEDNYFCLKVTLAAQCVRCIPEALYVRRCREGAITTSGMTEKKCSDLIKINRLMWEELQRHILGKAFLISFISSNLLYVYGIIASFDNKQIQREKDELLVCFEKYWLQLYLEADKSLGDAAILLLALRELKRKDPIIDELENRIVKEMECRLKEIPLGNPDKKIGIYGIGKHTSWLLDFYKVHIGDIMCDLYFIITGNVDNPAEFQGRSLVSSMDILPGTDQIVISSLAYQKDMYKELKARGVEDKAIKVLYDDKDICDLYSIWKALNPG